eukprot:235730-Chlamydomonas_euryale.AAC.1
MAPQFPIDDARLHELLRAKAEREGGAPPPGVADVPDLPGDDGAVLADLLYVCDFLQTFHKQLALPSKSAVGVAELDAAVDSGSGGGRRGGHNGDDGDGDDCGGEDAARPTGPALLALVYERVLALLLDEEVARVGPCVAHKRPAHAACLWPGQVRMRPGHAVAPPMR